MTTRILATSVASQASLFPIPENAIVKTLTLIKDGGKWLASFSVDLPDRKESKQQPISCTGIDLGVNSFLFTSVGVCKKAPRYLHAAWKKIKKLQRKLSRLKKRTPKYLKALAWVYPWKPPPTIARSV